MESFFRTHKYLVEHLCCPIRRQLMDEINWDDQLIGIKGSRGVGKTTILLQYAKENFPADTKECLYINLNNFFFTVKTLQDFANEFRMKGGKVLLIDQVFKYPEWSKELRYCYDNYPDLKIIFTGSSVMRLKEENPDLSGKVVSYNLRGFSFREYLNLLTKEDFRHYSLDEIISNHQQIATDICKKIKPLAYLEGYEHHGFYPFFLEKRNFSENLLKTINMMLEVDVLSIKQIEQSYLPKLRKLLYLLSTTTPGTPNVSQLSHEIETSRATVMNYIKYLNDARLINMLYPINEEFPKKPAMLYMQDTNLMYAFRPVHVDMQALRETFFCNQIHKDYKVNVGQNNEAQFLIDNKYNFRIEDNDSPNGKHFKENYYAIDGIEIGEGKRIPLWLFGFLY
ncbi:MAG: AAA family ATPase [Dysgonamonadaceae bacterium]|nr:AAA family ATPase [Dysgonamonadaceae bacterium]